PFCHLPREPRVPFSTFVAGRLSSDGLVVARCSRQSSPRCEHPWWLDVMHNRERYRMPVDDFALARGATAPVTSKQEAEKVWEPKFIAEIVSGKDPRVPIERETKFERPTTVADLLKLYRTRYVEVEPLKSRAGML